MKKKNNIINIIKASRKINRETEIREHGKPINIFKIMESKKIYSRKRNKDINNQD
jgi:hypothetical protein